MTTREWIPKWILLAEDDKEDADMTMRALMVHQTRGSVVIASDGEEAIDCLYRRGEFQTRDTGNPTLVLLDLKMPKLNGLEVLRQIRADIRFKTIPVVVFSSSRQEADVAECYELGANAYVVKPVNFRDFLAAIKAIKMFWLSINEPPPVSHTTSKASVMQTATAAC